MSLSWSKSKSRFTFHRIYQEGNFSKVVNPSITAESFCLQNGEISTRILKSKDVKTVTTRLKVHLLTKISPFLFFSLLFSSSARIITRIFRTWKFTSSMSHMATFSTVLCLSNSLAVEPSPPPMMKMFLGLNYIWTASQKHNSL